MYNSYSVVSQQILIVKRIITLLLLLFLTNSYNFPIPDTRLNISFPFYYNNRNLTGKRRGGREGEGGGHTPQNTTFWTTSYNLWLPPQTSGKRSESPQDLRQISEYLVTFTAAVELYTVRYCNGDQEGSARSHNDKTQRSGLVS